MSLDTVVNAVSEDETLAQLEEDFAAPAFNPMVLTEDAVDPVEVDWIIAGVVAAAVGIAVAIVIYICSVCDARSIGACITAVRRYFTPKGC